LARRHQTPDSMTLQEIDIQIPANIPSDQIVAAIDATVARRGLTVTLRGALKTFPGSTHWHLKRGRGRGTLEMTWWPKVRRLWIKIQAGRTAAWIDEAVPHLKEEIESLLHRLTRSAEPGKKVESRSQ
jgi:predicted nucleotidyltransferase